jgi:nitrilase
LLSDCPENYAAIRDGNRHTILMRGGSAIVSPLGDVLAGPQFDGETILTADLDLDEIARGKCDFDVTGHYARPDIFELHVNERSRRSVSIEPTEATLGQSISTEHS